MASALGSVPRCSFFRLLSCNGGSGIASGKCQVDAAHSWHSRLGCRERGRPFRWAWFQKLMKGGLWLVHERLPLGLARGGRCNRPHASACSTVWPESLGAELTPGADISKVCNEAALIAAHRQSRCVH